jgi:hypothetical protein
MQQPFQSCGVVRRPTPSGKRGEALPWDSVTARRAAPSTGSSRVRSWMELNRWDCAQLAKEVGCGYNHLYLAIVGRTPPSPLLRQKLPQILGAELPDLFIPQAIAADFHPKPRQGGSS